MPEPLVVGLVTQIARRLRLVSAVGLATAIVSIGFVLVQREWLSDSQFLPSQPSAATAAGLSAVAAQFGITVGSTDQQGPQFYVTLLTSRKVLESVLISRYKDPSVESTTGRTLFQILDLHDQDTQDTLRAEKKLSDRITVIPDMETSVVDVRVEMPGAWLAEEVNRRLLDEVSAFNLEQRQTTAGAEAEFLAGRVAAAHAALDSAERDLQHFEEQNRTVQSSPRLEVEAARLQRRVDLSQQQYVSLLQAEEQARLAQIRDTPVLTIIAPPEGSAQHAHRVVFTGIAGAAAGVVVALLFVLFQGALEAAAARYPADYAEWTNGLRRVVQFWRRRQGS